MNIATAVKDYIQTELLNGNGAIELAEEDDLLLSGLVDSMGVVRLLNFIEQELQIPVPPEDVTIDHFLTVHAIADYLEARRVSLIQSSGSG